MITFKQYKENKKRCGRHPITLPNDQQEYIQKMAAQGWTPDVIIGRAERFIACSLRTLYQQFKQGFFDQTPLPMKGKRKPNGHKEKRGKQAFKRNISERLTDYLQFEDEFGHLEGDTIIGIHHKSAALNLTNYLKIKLAFRGAYARGYLVNYFVGLVKTRGIEAPNLILMDFSSSRKIGYSKNNFSWT